MKILLVAVNAKYIHSNLAVYSLRAFAGKYAPNIKILELTINHSEEDILKEIYREKADVVAFSCYIWNISMIKEITNELRKVQKKVKIWYGGPEVSYDSCQCLQENKNLDGIMIGEGEQSFLELAGYYVEGLGSLEEIDGLAFKKSARLSPGDHSIGAVNTGRDRSVSEKDGICVTPDRRPLSLDEIPFPYKNMETFCNRIIYYESSRGCPFSCSYCLSSIDKSVRLRNTELVKKELSLFLDYKVPQVKFVDRTFNCSRQHAMEIWQFIKEHDNGITNFHFEISADLLSEEEIEFLASLRPGQIQFEIGVQSTNQDTIRAIHRKMDLNKLNANVQAIKRGRNIHQHLDLIAGLPLEDYASFEKSFNDVYRLKPNQLQLGFLKVLKGSSMEEESNTYGISFRSTPPYEVLYTDNLSYDEILVIKGICDMIEVYYNSTQFTYSIGFLEHFYASSMKLYEQLHQYYESKGLSRMAHSRVKRYEILLDFYQEVIAAHIAEEDRQAYIRLFQELLVMDLFLREDIKTRPGFIPANPLQGRLREIYEKYQVNRKLIHIEQFTFNVFEALRSGKAVKKDITLLFDYHERDFLTKSAKVTKIEV